MTAVYTLECGIKFPTTEPGLTDAREHKTVCRLCTLADRMDRESASHDVALSQMQRIINKKCGVRCG